MRKLRKNQSNIIISKNPKLPLSRVLLEFLKFLKIGSNRQLRGQISLNFYQESKCSLIIQEKSRKNDYLKKSQNCHKIVEKDFSQDFQKVVKMDI